MEEEANSSISSFFRHLSPRPHCPGQDKLRHDACVRNTEGPDSAAGAAQRYAKQISSSYKFGTSELNGASRNGEIKECTGDEWRCEWERVGKERLKGKRGREERRERTQTERTKLPSMVIEVEQRVKQRHCRSRFSRRLNLQVTDSRGICRSEGTNGAQSNYEVRKDFDTSCSLPYATIVI